MNKCNRPFVYIKFYGNTYPRFAICSELVDQKLRCKKRFTKLFKSVLFTPQLAIIAYLPSTFLTIRASLEFSFLCLDTDDWTILLCKLGVSRTMDSLKHGLPRKLSSLKQMDIITPQPLAPLVIGFPYLLLILDPLKQMDITSP